MGFRCPDCGKDFGNNKEWFEDHLKAHKWDRKEKPIPIILERYKSNADLKAIQNAIKSNKLRIWMNHNGEIIMHNMKTHNELIIEPFYTMEGELCDDNPLVKRFGKCPEYEGIK